MNKVGKWVEDNLDPILVGVIAFMLVSARGGSSLAVFSGIFVALILGFRAHNLKRLKGR